MNKLLQKNGFTMIEIMMYFAITSVFLLSITLFSIQIMTAFRWSENMHEIQTSGNFITDKFVEKIHSAESIETGTSVFDSDDGVLALNGTTSSRFYLDAGNLYLIEDSGDPMQLNSSDVKFNFLRFTRVVSPKTPDQVVIDAEIESISEITSYNRSYPYHLSLSLRRF